MKGKAHDSPYMQPELRNVSHHYLTICGFYKNKLPNSNRTAFYSKKKKNAYGSLAKNSTNAGASKDMAISWGQISYVPYACTLKS